MEDVVLMRKSMMLGKILRFGGKFEELLAHLKNAREAAERHGLEMFDEDLSSLTCDLADTLRELNDLVSAE
jgi:hypothetical protein